VHFATHPGAAGEGNGFIFLTASGKRGLTSTSSEKPMVLMARAAEPILPGLLVLTSTKRKRLKRDCPDTCLFI
jgi:hypothetical protein